MKKALKPKQTRQAVFEKINWINQLRKLSSFDDDLISDLLYVAAMTGDEKLFTLLEDILTPLAQEQLIRPHPFKNATPPEIGNDLIYIGEMITGEGHAGKLMIPLVSFMLHSLIAGIIGIGKSFLIKLIVTQLIAKGITVIIFDSENDFKDLLGVVRPEKILIFDAHTDRDNFLEPPPGVSPKEWLAKLTNIFREMFLRDGSINLLREFLIKIYIVRGIFNGGDDYPTILDLVNLLENTQFKPGSRFSGYLESLTNRFKGLLENLSETFTCKKGYDLTKEQEGKIIIYRTGNLSDDIRNFYINLKMLKEATYREKLPPQGLKTVFVLDEAHKLYNEKLAQRYDLGEPMIFSSSRTFRKRGIGCIYADQVPSELPSVLSGNVSNHIVFRLVNGKCIWRVSQSINLNPEQAEYLPVMPKRHCIFQSGDYPEPVLVEIPELSFRYTTEDEVKAHMEPILARLDYTPAEETAAIELSMGISSFSQNQAGKSKQKPNELWKRILDVVAKNAPACFTEIYQGSGVDHWQGRKILESMEKHDLIETCAVGFGARGKPKTFVVLKPKGAEFIGLDYEAVRLKGRGDAEHVILQHLISQALKDSGSAGSVEVEHHINGKAVDIAEIRDDRSIAYEIELAPAHPHVVENVRLDFQAGFSQVVVITRNKASQIEAKNRIVSEIEFEKLSKVDYRLPKDFLPTKKTGKK